MRLYGQRQLQANIWGIHKIGITNRIYVTDRNGMVLLDSCWNGAYLTLHG